MAISAVFDTVIFVRSLINPQSRWGRLVFEKAESYRLVALRETIAEVLVVISRPESTRKFRGFVARIPNRARLRAPINTT